VSTNKTRKLRRAYMRAKSAPTSDIGLLLSSPEISFSNFFESALKQGLIGPSSGKPGF